MSGLEVIAVTVQSVYFSKLPGTSLIIVGMQLVNNKTEMYNFDMLILNLDTGETMYYK